MAPPTVQDVAAELATLKERISNNEGWLKDVAADTKAIRQTLDQAQGGMAVLKWLVGGSLAAFIGLLVMLYQYVTRAHGAH